MTVADESASGTGCWRACFDDFKFLELIPEGEEERKASLAVVRDEMVVGRTH